MELLSFRPGGIETRNNPVIETIDRQIGNLETVVQKTVEAERDLSGRNKNNEYFFCCYVRRWKSSLWWQKNFIRQHMKQKFHLVVSVEQTTIWEISAKKIIDNLTEEKKKKIINSSTYKETVKKMKRAWSISWTSRKDSNTTSRKSSYNTYIREFSYNISHENGYWFSVETINKIKTNEELMIFNELFEKTIIKRYDDITDRNHLDRDLPVPLDPYFETIAENNGIWKSWNKKLSVW